MRNIIIYRYILEVVRAGSVDEQNWERGAAHFLEHLVFRGTEKFSGKEIREYFESVGL